jgi:hypothetical protein
MVILGIDAHKRTHTVVAVDEHGRKLGERTVGTTTADHLGLLVWASRFGAQRRWAVQDRRHLSRRLEHDLLGGGQQVVRVPPKLMANARTAARTYGKSDPIDALAVARAAPREPELPVAPAGRPCPGDPAAGRPPRATWSPSGNTPTEAMRALKRRLSDVVYRALLADATVIDADKQTAAA